MGNAAEFIAREFAISREEMDLYALRSHERAALATAVGHFAEEIEPVQISDPKGSRTVTVDEPIRARFAGSSYELTTSLSQLAALRPAFEEDGRVTAGNAPGLNDGAAALVLASRPAAERQGLRPLARIVGYTAVGVDPQWIFSAPAKAIPRLLDKIGWRFDDVDLFELNEAFAAQVLANIVDLARQGYELELEKLNVNGGAIALGHPVGASGARVLVTLLYALRSRGLKRGVAVLCLGGGEAIALAIEAEP
jgi:acetyl-CoA C-acetyltransferase